MSTTQLAKSTSVKPPILMAVAKALEGSEVVKSVVFGTASVKYHVWLTRKGRVLTLLQPNNELVRARLKILGKEQRHLPVFSKFKIESEGFEAVAQRLLSRITRANHRKEATSESH